MLKIFEMFAGYGGASFALKKAGIPFECVGYSEIDKYAIQCWEQNHSICNTYCSDGISRSYPLNYGDCTKINPNELPDFDLLTGGFPCQAFSVAGKMQGELDSRGTLFNEIIRIAEIKKPKYMLLENVKGLTSKKFKDTFNKILSELDRIGYSVRWEVLNSKDYGVPQSRVRVWFVCYRNDNNGSYPWKDFQFPQKEELKIFLKDILEDEADEKYYLKEEQVKRLLPNQEISYSIDANYAKGINVEQFIKKKRRQLIQVNNPTHSNDRVYSSDGISPTLNTMSGGNRQPFIVASRGRNPSDRTTGSPTKQRLEPKFDGTSNCISTVQKDNYVCEPEIKNIGMINQICKKRNYDTPKDINYFLKKHKKNFTIQEISDKINIPKTQVEHYFRTDSSRAIPSPEVWNKLKDLLNFNDTWDKQVTDIYEKEVTFESARRVYDAVGISPTISSTNADKIIRIKNATSKGYQEARPYDGINLEQPNSNTRRGRVQLQSNSTLQCNDLRAVVTEDFRIRKLTPKECFRLMGFLNDEINLDGISNSQRYKLAGNGWDINLVSKIFKEVLERK